MNEITEFQRITDKEDRRVVAHHVPITFFGVELYGKAAWVSFRIGRAFLPAQRGEADKYRGTFTNIREEPGTGVLWHALVCTNKTSIGSGPFGMNHTLRDPFTVEVGHLFK